MKECLTIFKKAIRKIGLLYIFEVKEESTFGMCFYKLMNRRTSRVPAYDFLSFRKELPGVENDESHPYICLLLSSIADAVFWDDWYKRSGIKSNRERFYVNDR